MIQLKSGEIAKLTVLSEEGSQWILTNGDVELPINASELQEEIAVGDAVDVFIYADRRGGLSATTMLPTITQDSYGWARVIRVDKTDGAYVDIGTSREVLVPAEDLPQLKNLWPEAGDHLYVTLRVEREGGLFGRLITEEKVEELYEGAFDDMHNKNIIARPYRLLPVGTFLLTTDETPFRIFVHETEREQEPRLGQDITVRIIDVKDDGTLNASMLPRKHERLSDDAERIYKYLEDVGGKMPFGDKSAPEEIQEMFKMSKGAFKRALGTLMKAKRVTQADGWTEIL